MSADTRTWGAEDTEPLSINNEAEESGGEAAPPAAEAAVGANKFRLTMEVPLFCMFFSVALSGAVINNMLLERTCRRVLGYNASVCAELQRAGDRDNDTRRLELQVQGVTTMILMCKTVLEGVFPAVLSLFLGVWSNTHGRKPLVVWPVFGYALSAMLVTLYSLLDWLSPWWYVGTSLPFSLGGGGSALFTGAFCYLSDITTLENRSFRLATLESSLFIGSILGSLASPYTVAALGTPCLLLVASCVAVAGYLYTNLCVEESVVGAVQGGVRSIFDASHVKDMLRTCFKRRTSFDRAVLFLLLVSNSINIFIMYGLSDIDYLYARRKLAWTLKDYSVFSAVNMVVMIAGLMFGVGVLQRRCKINDIAMTLVAFLSSMVETIIKAIATAGTSWLMYFGSSVSLLRGLSSPLIRSLMSKRLAPEDVAKMFAFMSALEAVLPIFSPIVYSTLYKYTLSALPGAVYFMTLAIYGACFCMVCVAQYFMVKYPTQQYSLLEC